MKTLVVAPNWIGDALMAQPLLALLRQAHPDERFTAVAPRWVAPVLAAMPEVDAVIATDLAHGRLQWPARRALAKAIEAEGFDRAIVLPNSFKSALVPWLAGIPERIGYRGEWRYGLVNRMVAGPDVALPMRARYAALAVGAGVAVPSTLASPRLDVSADAVTAARMRFGLNGALQSIALCPGAEYGPAKRWPVGHYASLAQSLLADRPEAQLLLLGGPGDRELTAAVRAAVDSDRVHDLAGRTALSEAIALIAGCDWVISNDSGLMHVAAALSRPQVAIFGSSDPRHTPPLSSQARTLWLHLDCSPCFARVCPLGHLDCLNGIAPGRVLDSMQNAPT